MPRATRSARPMSRVQMDPERPYAVSLAFRTASSSSSNGITATTGPKISSCHTASSVPRGSTTVAGYQNPSPPGQSPRKATSTGAVDSSTEERTRSR